MMMKITWTIFQVQILRKLLIPSHSNNIKHYLNFTIYHSTQISATSKNVIFVSTDTKII